MNGLLTALLTVVGGVGIFMLGLKHFSEGLQAVLGQVLRRVMFKSRSGAFAGVLSGAVSTLLVQSSSIITVMAVSFVSAATMSLANAVNVLIGASIGTTATVWLFVFGASHEMTGLILLGLGAVMYFFISNPKIHNIGFSAIGIGMAFLGFFLMTKGFVHICFNAESAKSLFELSSVSGVADAALVALVAAFVAAVFRASSVAIIIAMILASLKLISYESAIAVLFGSNVGTTVTGWLVAVKGSSAAKRMALFNTVTNFVSSAVLICFYPVFVRIGNLFNVGALTPQTVDFGKGIGAVGVFASIMIPIALTDTILSVCRAVISMLLKRVLMPVVNSVISQPEDEKPHLSILKIGARISPVLACDQVLVEVDFMKQSIFEMFDCAYKVISGVSKNDQGPEKHIVHRERILDNVQREITEFLGSVMSNRLPVEVAERARRLLRLTDELESASDELAKILKIIKRLASDGRELTQETKKLLLEVHNSVLSEVELITPLICSPRKVFDLSSVQESSFRLKSFLRACRQSQIERIGPDDSVSAKRILAVIDVINAYDRIRAYYLNCAETLAGGKR